MFLSKKGSARGLTHECHHHHPQNHIQPPPKNKTKQFLKKTLQVVRVQSKVYQRGQGIRSVRNNKLGKNRQTGETRGMNTTGSQNPQKQREAPRYRPSQTFTVCCSHSYSPAGWSYHPAKPQCNTIDIHWGSQPGTLKPEVNILYTCIAHTYSIQYTVYKRNPPLYIIFLTINNGW